MTGGRMSSAALRSSLLVLGLTVSAGLQPARGFDQAKDSA
jgi:hypothetical protein